MGLAFVPAAHAQRKPMELELSGMVEGGPQRSQQGWGSWLGATVLARSGWWAGGFEGRSSFGGGLHTNGTGLLGGVAWQLDAGPRLQLLGVLGMDMQSARDDAAPDDPGSDAFLPRAGVRAAALFRFGPPQRTHVLLGILAGYSDDLLHVTRRYEYTSHTLFGNEVVVTGEKDFGFSRFELGVSAGLTFDLLPCP